MARTETLELPVAGMDCAECTQHVRHAIAELPGVESVNVYLSSEKAVIRLDPSLVELPTLRKAVEKAGYRVPDTTARAPTTQLGSFSRRIVVLLGVVFGAVLFIIVVGEWFGMFQQLPERVPVFVGLAVVIVSGWPIFLNVARATLKRQVTSHALMTIGLLAALVIGEWATAAVIVFFMRVGDYADPLSPLAIAVCFRPRTPCP